MWHEDPPGPPGASPPRRDLRTRHHPIDGVAIEAALRRRLDATSTLTVDKPPYRSPWRASILTIVTHAPRDVVAGLAAQANELGAKIGAWAVADDPLAATVQRVIHDVSS